MRYSTVPAINFEAHVQRNRELISNCRHGSPPGSGTRYRVWHDGQWIVNPTDPTLKQRMPARFATGLQHCHLRVANPTTP